VSLFRFTSEARDPLDRLLEDGAEGGAGERPDDDDEPGRHQGDEHPAGDVAAVVTEVGEE